MSTTTGLGTLNVATIVAEGARRHRTKTAVVTALPDGVHELTYGDLWERVRQTAGGLRARGVERGDRVAVMLPNVPEFLVATSPSSRWAPSSCRAAPVPAERGLHAEPPRWVASTARSYPTTARVSSHQRRHRGRRCPHRRRGARCPPPPDWEH